MSFNIKKRGLLLSVTMVMIFFPSFVFAQMTPEAKKLFEHVFSEREKIWSGHLIIEYTRVLERDGKIETRITHQEDVIFDHEKIRVAKNSLFGRENKKADETICFGCMTPETHLYINSRTAKIDSNDQKLPPPISLTSLAKAKNRTERIAGGEAMIPRYLACSTDPIVFDKKESETVFWGNAEDMRVTITDEVIDGTSCKKVKRDIPTLTDHVFERYVWIAENQGYSVRKIETELTEFTEQSGTIPKSKLSIEFDVALDAKSGIWFPVKWSSHGKQVDIIRGERHEKSEKNEGTIKVVSLNQPIDPKYFTLPEIEMLKPGATVLWNMDTPQPVKGRLVWDGQNIVSQGDYLMEVQHEEINSSQRIKIIAVNIALISTLITIFLYRRYKKQQSL